MVDLAKSLLDFILHIDQHLVTITSNYQTWTYAILFLIIFAETGFVVTPFLPGDSLLFAAGAIIAKPETGLNIVLMFVLLVVAAILGDLVNYAIGKKFGSKAFSGKIPFLKLAHLQQTQAFYQKYGGKTIVYARFIPIVRTFAPFIAGIGEMSYRKFAFYNIAGGILWVGLFLFLGYYFGGMPVIKNNFTYVIIALIILSVLPPLFGMIRGRIQRQPV